MDYASAAVWSTSYKNNLPDSAFLYIEPGGKKDEDGKTTPRSLRHFPYKDSTGKIDIIHVRNAIARIPTASIPKGLKKPLQDKARRLLKDSNKRSKSHLFKSLLNKIAISSYDDQLVPPSTPDSFNSSNPDNSDPCCAVLHFGSPNNYRYQQIEALKNQVKNNSLPRKEFQRKYTETIIALVSDLIYDYCDCNDFNSVGSGSSPSPCHKALQSKLSSTPSMTIWIDELENIFQQNKPSHVDILQSFNIAFSELADAATDVFQTDGATAGWTIDPRTNNLKDFLDDMCKIKDTEPIQYSFTSAEFTKAVAANQFFLRAIDKIYIDASLSVADIESLTANCPPSTGDESVISLLGALGAGAAGLTVVGYLGAILKGNVKKCANKRQAAQTATTKLLALLGAGVGSFSATQVSEAEIVDRVEDIIIKDCEGRLPYSCGEGGFEGPDDGDESGEVDAPDGGGIGGIG